MNQAGSTVVVDEEGAALAAALDDTARMVDKMMEVKRYVVRHRCGQPIRLYLSRAAAQAAADTVASPARHGLRVAVATRADVVATVAQRHCEHIVIAAT